MNIQPHSIQFIAGDDMLVLDFFCPRKWRAIGTASTGDLWLKNEHGVIMRLVAKRQGLMLSLGLDAVVIQMNQ
jgi:hypothetical protein